MKKPFSRELAKTIGTNAREVRELLGWTQERTADELEITTDFYARLERGQQLPSVVTLWHMMKVLNVRADRLLGTAEKEVLLAHVRPEIAFLAGYVARDPTAMDVIRAVVAALNESNRGLASE